jgi:uncharacterized protein (TIGR00290 family)
MEKIACSWSGGKDSCFALMQMMEHGSFLSVLVNMMNENGIISRSHGIPLSILQQQANAMDIPLVAIPTSWKDYEKNFTTTLQHIKNAYGVATMVFGDIDLQAHRDWEEMVCTKADLNASLPLWKRDRKQLVYEILNAGIETMIVSCNTVLGENFLGRIMNESLISELESKGVDVCGENGEFHTLVLNCPLFKNRIDLPGYEKTKHEEYWFLQWET